MAVLAEVLGNPTMLDTLPLADLINVQRELDHTRADLSAAIERARANTVFRPADPDRAMGIEEAAGVLGMSKDYLYRHWSQLGGYRDHDRRVKFPLSEIQRHIRRGRPRA